MCLCRLVALPSDVACPLSLAAHARQAFGAFASPRGVSPSRSVLSSPRSLGSRHQATRWGRDVAPCMPHTISVYKRPRNEDQLPRWLKHRTTDNWNQPSYVYSPGISGKCHFHLDSKFHWKPPVDDRFASRATRTGTGTPRGFQLPPDSPLASAPSSPRLRTALILSRQSSQDEAWNASSGMDRGPGGSNRFVLRSPPSTAGTVK